MSASLTLGQGAPEQAGPHQLQVTPAYQQETGPPLIGLGVARFAFGVPFFFQTL